MSLTLQEVQAQAPFAKFPTGLINKDEFVVSAPNESQVAIIQQYYSLINNGQYDAAKQLMDQNPDIKNKCTISSTTFNKLIHEVYAIELYYKNFIENRFEEFLEEVAEKIGINDNDVSTINSYSSSKLESMITPLSTKIDQINEVLTVDISVSDWESDGSGGYTCTKTLPGIDSTMYPMWYYNGTPTAEQYETFCYISSLQTNDGSITLTCASDEPYADISIMIKRI